MASKPKRKAVPKEDSELVLVSAWLNARTHNLSMFLSLIEAAKEQSRRRVPTPTKKGGK